MVFLKPRVLVTLAAVVLAAILWQMELWNAPQIDAKNHYIECPAPFNTSVALATLYGTLLWPERFRIGLYLFGITAICEVALAVVPVYRRRKRCYMDILTHFINRWFQGDFHNYRITVYRVSRGISVLPWYIWKCLIRNFGSHRKKGLLLHYLKRLPLPWRQYLHIYVRKGLPYEDGSSCCFLIPHCDKEVVSLTAHAWYVERQVDTGDLPELNIDNLDQNRTVESIKNDKLKGASGFVRGFFGQKG